MKKGDLIYIPQDVDLWDMQDNTSNIKYFKTTSVALRCIYPMEQGC
jgi:hypothetical protein